VDEEVKVNIIRMIINKYVNEGYGCQRLVRYLYEQCIVKSNGEPFSRCNIYCQLQNELYMGYLKRGDIRTFVPRLKIIDDDLFNRAQELRKVRNKTLAFARIEIINAKQK